MVAGRGAAYDFGDEHVANEAPSSEQANVVPPSLDENANAALGSVVGSFGPDEIVVSGGVVSASVPSVRVNSSTSKLWPDPEEVR